MSQGYYKILSEVLKEFLIFHFSKTNYFREVDFDEGSSDI